MPNHLTEKLGANISDDLVAHPLHVVGISERAEAPYRHDGRYSETDKNDRINFRAGVQGFKIRAQGHRAGSSSVEDSTCHPGDDQREERIDQAEGKTQRQSQYKAHLVRLDVTIKPPVWTRDRPNGLPE